MLDASTTSDSQNMKIVIRFLDNSVFMQCYCYAYIFYAKRHQYLYNSFGPADIISAEGLINETIKYISQNISFISEYVGFWLFLMKQI